MRLRMRLSHPQLKMQLQLLLQIQTRPPLPFRFLATQWLAVAPQRCGRRGFAYLLRRLLIRLRPRELVAFRRCLLYNHRRCR